MRSTLHQSGAKFDKAKLRTFLIGLRPTVGQADPAARACGPVYGALYVPEIERRVHKQVKTEKHVNACHEHNCGRLLNLRRGGMSRALCRCAPEDLFFLESASQQGMRLVSQMYVRFRLK